jgi:lipopolysaccharide/colanic/teichoic acid biosynthesis glycosyltransferase
MLGQEVNDRFFRLAPSRRAGSLRCVSLPTGVEALDPKAVLPVSPLPPWKRAMDVLGAVAGLIALSPLFALTALIVKAGSRGPVFFRQERAGLGGKNFAIWKFRTMHVANDAGSHRQYVRQLLRGDGALEKMDRQCRIIPLGGLLRILALDELPQLINVLKGEMSLVGPRPDVLAFEDYQPWQQVRFCVTPGMTGLWQVSGKNRTTFNEMLQLDIAYVNDRSFWLDVSILLRTGPALLSQALAACSRRKQDSLPGAVATEMESL